MEQQFARESEPLEKRKIVAKGAFTAAMEARSEPTIERSDNAFMITADLGWGSELTCFVYDDVVDTGTAAHLVLKGAAKDVQFKVLEPYFLKHFELDPILGIRGVYHVEQNGKLAAGDLKIAVMPRLERPLLCWQDSPGYAKSFERVVKDFASSFQFATDDQPAPQRAELWAIKLDQVPVGFVRDSLYKLKGGSLRSESVSALFITTAPGEMSFEDEAKVLTLNPDGTLVSGKYVSIENDSSSLTIDLERTKAGYNYVGNVKDKEVKGSFTSKTPIKGQLAVENKLKTLAGKKEKATFEQLEYHPSIDPTKAIPVSYEVTPESDGFNVLAKLGERTMKLKANQRGVLSQQSFAAGPKTIQSDLVESVGEP